jgi:RNA polymerase sigma factor (TIGR02999 family)
MRPEGSPLPDEEELTRFLSELGRGEHVEDSAPMRYVYERLRATAERYMKKQSSGHTLQPTALVHDAFVKLFDREPIEFNDRVHFFALSARIMRQNLVDKARRRREEVGDAIASADAMGLHMVWHAEPADDRSR